MWTKVVLLLLCILYLSSGVARGNDEAQAEKTTQEVIQEVSPSVAKSNDEVEETIMIQEADVTEEQEEVWRPKKKLFKFENKCEKPVGSLAVIETKNKEWQKRLKKNFHVKEVKPYLSLLIESSNCFVVSNETDRADYLLIPEIISVKKLGLWQQALIAGIRNIDDAFSDPFLGLAAGVLGSVLSELARKSFMEKDFDVHAQLILIDNKNGEIVVDIQGGFKGYRLKQFRELVQGNKPKQMGGFGGSIESWTLGLSFFDAYNKLVDVVKNGKEEPKQVVIEMSKETVENK
ncbi:MAG: hypothetical protein N2327_01985 [Caldimicrobium sp.]|nr:hypothetical protein [Caldimicrobium sp.]